MSDSAGSSAPSSAPSISTGAAPGGSSPLPQTSDVGQKSIERLIDQSSQMTLAQKLGNAQRDLSAANDNAYEKPPAPSKAQPAPAGKDEKSAPAPQKYKVKTPDGKEQELTLEELQRDYEVRAVSTKRLQEATELQKKLGAVLGVIQSNTGEALRAAGLTDEQIESFAVQLIAERQRAYLEEERIKNATPEEKEVWRLRQVEAEFKKHQEQLQQQQRTQQFEAAKYQISQNVIATLEQLPKEYRKNDFVASRALDAWQYAYENAQQLRDRGVSVTPQTIAKALRAEIEGLGKSLAQLAKEAVATGQPIPQSAPRSQPAQPGQSLSRKTAEKKEPEKKEPLSQAQLMRQIILGQR